MKLVTRSAFALGAIPGLCAIGFCAFLLFQFNADGDCCALFRLGLTAIFVGVLALRVFLLDFRSEGTDATGAVFGGLTLKTLSTFQAGFGNASLKLGGGRDKGTTLSGHALDEACSLPGGCSLPDTGGVPISYLAVRLKAVVVFSLPKVTTPSLSPAFETG